MRERLLGVAVIVLAIATAVSTVLLVARDDRTDSDPRDPVPTTAATTIEVTVVCGAGASAQDCASKAEEAVRDACLGPGVTAVELTESSGSTPEPTTRTIDC